MYIPHPKCEVLVIYIYISMYIPHLKCEVLVFFGTQKYKNAQTKQLASRTCRTCKSDLADLPSPLGKSAKSDLQVHLQVPISPNKHLQNLSESNLADFSTHTKRNLQNLKSLQILAKLTKENKELQRYKTYLHNL